MDFLELFLRCLTVLWTTNSLEIKIGFACPQGTTSRNLRSLSFWFHGAPRKFKRHFSGPSRLIKFYFIPVKISLNRVIYMIKTIQLGSILFGYDSDHIICFTVITFTSFVPQQEQSLLEE